MNQSTPKTGNNEVHELRYRLSQLEHLIVHSSLNSTNLNASSLPSNASLLNSHQGLVTRINDLEGLLAASEHENSKLKSHIELITVDKNRQEVKLLEKVFQIDTEKNDLEQEYKLLDVKYQKAQRKLGNIQEYVNELPSQDELEDARQEVVKLQEENQLLERKLSRTSDNVASLQKERLSLELSMNLLQSRLEELQPLEEAQKTFNADGSFEELDDPQKTKECLTLQKAQILRSSKVISTLRNNITQFESEKADRIIQITNLESDIQSLQEQLLTTQMKLETLSEKFKALEQEKNDVKTENTQLKNAIQQTENNLQTKDEHIHCIIKLATEIDLSVRDVEKLVELGRSLALGEEPSVSTLLGLSEDLEMHLDNANNTSSEPSKFGLTNNLTKYDPNDYEWTLDRLVKIRSLRKHLGNLRDIASDLYTDMISGNVEGCKVQ